MLRTISPHFKEKLDKNILREAGVTLNKTLEEDLDYLIQDIKKSYMEDGICFNLSMLNINDKRKENLDLLIGHVIDNNLYTSGYIWPTKEVLPRIEFLNHIKNKLCLI